MFREGKTSPGVGEIPVPPLCINTAVNALLDEANCDVHVNSPACKKQKSIQGTMWPTA